MLPPIIWVGPFWMMPSMSPGGSGCTAIFSTPLRAAAAQAGRAALPLHHPAVAALAIRKSRRFMGFSW
ncbi:hypothetical protein D3C86_2164180 [compost metagenome]